MGWNVVLHMGSTCGVAYRLIIWLRRWYDRPNRRGSSLLPCLPLPLILIAFLCLTSCTANNWSFVRQQNASAVMSMYRARPLEAVNGGQTILTIQDCTRIALANSLDLQAVLWEEQVREKIARAGQVKMLPRMDVFYGLMQRDRPAWSRSDVIDQEGAWEVVGPGPATGVTNFSTAREHNQRYWNVQAAWSPMDALMAGYLGQIKSNDALYSRYQRARVAQQLVGTVTSAFYRLLALHEALPKAQALENHRKNIVKDLGSLARNALVDNQEYLNAQSLHTEAKNQLSAVYADIERQRELLAAAMNVSPCSNLKLEGSLLPLPPTELDSCALEAAALVNRPECYQSDLVFANSVADAKRLMVKFFPRVDGFIGYFRDENKFFLNKNWIDGGMRITWDLMDFTANYLEHGAAQDRVVKTDQDRAVISMGILTQVKLKTLDSMKAVDRFKRASELTQQASEALRIAIEVETAKMRGADQSLIRITREKAKSNQLQAELDRLFALGEVHSAIADLNTCAGTNYPISTAIPVSESSAAPRLSHYPANALKSAAGLVRRALPW